MRRMLRGLAVVAGVVAAVGLSNATASAFVISNLWLVNGETGKCMTSDQRLTPASVFQHRCGESRFDPMVQRWTYTDVYGSPSLFNDYNWGAASIYGSFPYVKANDPQWRTTYDRFYVGEGYYQVRNRGTRQCLSVGSYDDGALVYEWPCNINSRAQWWSFRRAA